MTLQVGGFVAPANDTTFAVFDNQANFSGIGIRATEDVYAWFNVEGAYIGEWIVAGNSVYIVFDAQMQEVGLAT